jgi:MYXO-CTERM domain-containing protein
MHSMSGSEERASQVRWVRRGLKALAMAAPLCAALTLAPPAHACGGFFCSATNPVNQSAERILFAQNDDGTVTAVIEILYQGPSQSFSWLLPISGVPMGDQIAVASNIAFQRLQQATNPQYNLNTRIEGTCNERETNFRGVAASSDNGAPNLSAGGKDDGVTVEASGVVGAFEWTVISLDDSLSSPADAAVQWLTTNGYDVPPGAPGLLGPYLADGLNLLALRLKKGADVGSIRPIVLTYPAEHPMIPIKLTAVAANENMGVLAWILGKARAVPQNYYSLELNEARINWFNAGSNYNDVVTAAADDASGQGFVTEMAGATDVLADQIWSVSDDLQWQNVRTRAESAGGINEVLGMYSSFDGFWDVAQAHLTFEPPTTTLDQVKQCPSCYFPVADGEFLDALEADVIEPVRLVRDLIASHPQITRLYSTLSASEMTVDPLFSFNPDLQAVSNVHTADRVIECSNGYYVDEAPWRIELPSGGVVRGGPTTLNNWPSTFDSLPANRRILRVGESGNGKVMEDNTDSISSALKTYGKSLPTPPRHSTGGCSFHGGAGSAGTAFVMLGLAAALLRRRRQGSADQY